MAKPLDILVTGATGTQGGAVARLLVKRGHRVRALTRDVASKAAQALAALGVELAQGNLEDRASVDRALAGMAAMFSVATPYERGPEAETRQSILAADAAAAAGAWLVYSSVANADRRPGVLHGERVLRPRAAAPGRLRIAAGAGAPPDAGGGQRHRRRRGRCAREPRALRRQALQPRRRRAQRRGGGRHPVEGDGPSALLRPGADGDDSRRDGRGQCQDVRVVRDDRLLRRSRGAAPRLSRGAVALVRGVGARAGLAEAARRLNARDARRRRRGDDGR